MPNKKESGGRPDGGCIAGLEEIFRSIADHSHVGIWLLDPGGTLVYANEAAERIWSRAPYLMTDEYDSYKAWDYETGQRIEREDWPSMRAIRSRTPVLDQLMRIELFDGEIKFILISAIPILKESGELSAVLVMNHDMTELKASEARREELTRIVSHDLKNPLHAIQMAAHLLQNKLGQLRGDEKGLEKINNYLAIISGSANVSLELVKNILDRGKNEKGPLQINCSEFSPCELLKSVRPIYDPLAEQKGLRLEWQIALADMIYADKERLSQVISNIVGNAIKFTPAGGEVIVSGSASEEEIIFMIRDTGPGIPQENLRKIFQKNFQGTEHPLGTGLGLYIAHMMVMAHGGKIWAESTPGKGSIFSFTLPRRRS